jgi:hypothetical protein
MRDDLLKAIETMGRDADPHEAIASKFARIFSDRMTEKRELLEQVRRGGDLTALLTPEVDAQVDVPVVSLAGATPLSNVRKPATVHKSRKKRSYSFLIAFLLASIGGAGVGAYLRMRNKPAPAAKREKLAVVPLPPPEAPEGSEVAMKVEAVEEVPPPAPVEEYIVISVETDPDGVSVKVDGESRGATPVDVKVKKSGDPLKIELASTGFATHKLDVVPDRDQRLYFALVKQAKKIVPVKAPPKKETKPGFRRFD